jgi:hypothetical protein
MTTTFIGWTFFVFEDINCPVIGVHGVLDGRSTAMGTPLDPEQGSANHG